MPSLNTARPVSSLLTNIAVEFANNADSYVGRTVCPAVSVDEETGTYFKFTLDSFYGSTGLQGNDLLRAPQSAYTRGGWDLTTGTFKCNEYGYEDLIDHRIAKGLDKYIEVAARCTKSATERMLIAREIRVASLFQTGGNWDTAPDVGGDWDAAGTPVTDIDLAVKTVLLAGRAPNTMIMSWSVWQALRKHSDITALFGNDERKSITASVLGGVLRDMFGIEHIHIGSALKNNALPGVDPSLTEVWGDGVWVGYINPEPSKEDPSAAYTFEFEDLAAYSYDEDSIRSSVVRVNETVSEAVISSSMGYLIDNAI